MAKSVTVPCACCVLACDGCGTISEILDGITSLSFQVNAQYTVNGDSQSASGSGVFHIFGNCYSYGWDSNSDIYGDCTVVYVSVNVTKNSQGDCIATISGAGGNGMLIGGPVDEDGNQTAACSTFYTTEGYITVPVDEIIGTHVLQNLTALPDDLASPISITVTIS